MVRAERDRPADRVAAALIVLLVAVGVVVVVVTSPAAHTTSTTWNGPVPTVPAEPSQAPSTLSEAWRTQSPATAAPLVAGPLVVAAGGEAVTGLDPLSGARRWLYRRDVPLCTVGVGWDMALAVYRNGSYCSEVTALRGDTGARGPQRNSDVPLGTQLVSGGSLVTATGWNHLETWRSDLVKTLEYGLLRAQLEPGSQPRPSCHHTSVAVTTGLVGVIERCPNEPTDRLTVLRPDNTESDTPDERFSIVLPARGARLVALSATREAVLLPNPPRLSIRDAHGAEVASYPLAPAAPGGAAPAIPARLALPVEPVQKHRGALEYTANVPGAILWWTGSDTVALDAHDLRPVWTLPGTLGPGTLFAGQLVIPREGAELVVNPANGTVSRSIAVTRNGYRGPVTTASIGPVLLEQRGPDLVALH